MSVTTCNFSIGSELPASRAFKELNIPDFRQAAAYIKGLPYGRNDNKHDLLSVFKDGRGTCGTKHGLLKQLAEENGAEDIQLILCIFKMNGRNTPKVAQTLSIHGLDYIPEAHNYLLAQGEILDCTNPGSSAGDFVPDLLLTEEIEPNQITDFKVRFHKAYIGEWLEQNPHIPYTPDELFQIREQCIADLSR